MTPSQWILTAAGVDQPISGPGLLLADVPPIDVIAHSLAHINRFTGHTTRPYSVAEHSELVSDAIAAMGLGPHAQLAALMHDAHECLVGDIASPVKWALGKAWLELENTIALLFRKRYRLLSAHAAHHRQIKQADLIALATERRDLMRFDAARNMPWPILDTPGAEVLPLESADLNNPARAAMSPRHHRASFIARFEVLSAQCSYAATPTLPTATA